MKSEGWRWQRGCLFIREEPLLFLEPVKGKTPESDGWGSIDVR